MAKSSFEKISDEKRIELYHSGDISHAEILLDKYKNLVRAKASTMFILGGDEQDLIQEGMIGLFKAIRTYEPEHEASFYTFADLCISRQIYNAITASGRLKNLPLNDYISFYADKNNGDEPVSVFENIADDVNNPEKKIIDSESIDEINEIIETVLTKVERDVFRLHLTGQSTSSIAAILGINPKSADNALQRARNKLKKEIKR